MNVQNIRWHPIRLQAKRVYSRVWWIYRAGKAVGEIEQRPDGDWATRPGYESMHEGKRCMLHKGGAVLFAPERWRAAVLHLCRQRGVWASSDGPQNYGQVHMLRINVATKWFTVIFDGDQRYLYEDFTIPEELGEERQVILQTVLAEAEKWKKVNI